MHIMTAEVTKLQNIEPIQSPVSQRIIARNQLGESFGTKKAKAAIRAAERNRVDVSAMEGVVSHLQESITLGTTSLPSQG